MTPLAYQDPPCPCGGPTLAACCGRYLDSGVHAPDAEALMRSRYTAFVLDDRKHLLATWHPSTRPAQLDPPEPGLKWLGLEVRAHCPMGDGEATIEFFARSKLGGRAQRSHELSRFVCESGRWYYVDGRFPDAG